MNKQNAKQQFEQGAEELRSHHLASLGALHEAGQNWHESLSGIQQANHDYMSNFFNSMMNNIKTVSAAKTPQDAMKLHNDWVQASMKMHLEHGKKLSKSTMDMVKHVAQPVQEHVKASVSKVMKKK